MIPALVLLSVPVRILVRFLPSALSYVEALQPFDLLYNSDHRSHYYCFLVFDRSHHHLLL